MAFGRKKKTNWERLSSRTPDQTTKFHDVYADQQLERSKIASRVSMKTRTIFVAVLSVLAFLVVYLMATMVQYSANLMFDVASPDESSPSAVQEELDDTRVGLPTSADPSISFDDFFDEYFVDVDTDDSVTIYEDVEGNQYEKADIQALWNEVVEGKHLDETAQRWREVEYFRENNEFGVLPITMAPTNITLEDFQSLYFARRDSDSMIVKYYDSNGTLYEYEDIVEAWNKVQSGQLGSGVRDTFPGVGGNDGTIEETEGATTSLGFGYFLKPSLGKVLISLFAAGIVWLIMYPLMKKNRDAQDAENSVDDINQYHNDQHIALPEEVMDKFDWFPDVGARCSVQVSSMISHVMLMNKGLSKIEMPRRAEKDIKDGDGDIVYYKGEILLDDAGKPIVDIVPKIDEAFGEALFDASGLPKDSKRTPKDQRLRKRYDTTKIPYNPGNGNRNKLKGYNTVADMINGDWELPEYEPQRPAGAYLVDTEPVNTMVLAITRAGKGQTVIEPTIDMWLREKVSNNIVCNDPKGELLTKFYVRSTVRGFQVVQFNLINPLKTDIYNRVSRFTMKSCNHTFVV